MSDCIICGGTLIDAFGKPCPNCSDKLIKPKQNIYNVPHQYQNLAFDTSFLPVNLQKRYGEYMLNLLKDITNNYAFYQKNILVCSRPNSGKTVWAYNLYSILYEKGIQIPSIKDVVEVRDLLNKSGPDSVLYSSARCAVIKVPIDFQFWYIESMAYIVERRVRSNGFTIFLFSGSLGDIEACDKYDKFKNIKGNGSFNSIQIADFSND